MASISIKPAQAELERVVSILAVAFERQVELKEFAQTLEDSVVPGLQSVVEAIIKHEDLDWRFLPESMMEYSEFDWAMDAAELVVYKTGSTCIPLVERLMREIAAEDDELLAQCGPNIVAAFQPDAAVKWLAYVQPTKKDATFELVVLDGVDRLVKEHVAIQKELAPRIVDLLVVADKSAPELNGRLVSLVMDWRLIDAAEVVERAFSRNLVDCGYAGNWEVVRQHLGVAGLGLPMPERPHDFVREFRLKMGIGAFSDKPIFVDGELDDSAVQLYLTNVREALRKFERDAGSTKPDCGDVVHTFLTLSLSYLGVHAETMTEADAKIVLLQLFPEKVSQSADDADGTIDELVAFWKYCDRALGLERAAGLAAKIGSWRERFRTAMSNPDNFGFAKSMVMAGIQAGFDMSSEEDVATFIQQYNQARLPEYNRRVDASFSSPSPINREERSDTASLNLAGPPITKDLKQRKKLLKKLKRK